MNLTMLLDMAVAGHGDRAAFGSITYAQLAQRAEEGAALLRAAGAERLVYVAANGVEFPIALFAAARAGVPLVPLNYRLGHDQLQALVDAQDDAVVILEGELRGGVELRGRKSFSPQEWYEATAATDGARAEDSVPPDLDGEGIAVLLYTSGTTAAPKAVIVRHRHLAAYVLETVEFGSADSSAASLVSVPPYHIAGVSNTITNVYAGRRVVHMAAFEPERWLDLVRTEGITNALVVPTMLARLVEHLDSEGALDADVPTLESLAYGGAPMPRRVIERALELFPSTGFVNAYGLTETSSTIALLGPQDHRDAQRSTDPAVRARLGSVGALLPGIEAEIRGPDGAALAAGETGDLYVRGAQVSGEYLGAADALDGEGWFPTRDRGFIDADGYLFVEGRADDTIIRGGENIAPAEVEAVMVGHRDVAAAAVVGLPDEEWGEVVAAVVVPEAGRDVDVDELKEWTRARLRSSKTPERIAIRRELPYTETGKLIRRELVEQLCAAASSDDPAEERSR